MPFLSIRTSEFYPLTLTMPLQKMLFGAMTMEHRWQKAINTHPRLINKWIEPTVMPNPSLIEAIEGLEDNQLLRNNEYILALNPGKVLLDKFNSFNQINQLHNFQEIDFNGKYQILSSLQYIIEHNEKQIARDKVSLTDTGNFIQQPHYFNTITPPDYILNNVTIDDSKGPVIIYENANISPGARLMGPLVLFPHSVVKMGAELYPGTTVGSHAVVSGEVKNSIVHDYSAKGHYGYLGDSILGRWNNLGAGTTVSNVSNTFSPVTIRDWNSGKPILYNGLKRGLITGDFVKLGIMSKVYRGTAIGSFTSVATNDPLSGNISPFTWWSGNNINRYETLKLCDHCQQQMALRQQTWDSKWEDALQKLLHNMNEKTYTDQP